MDYTAVLIQVGLVAVAVMCAGFLYRRYRPSYQYLIGRDPDSRRWVRLYRDIDLHVVQDVLETIRGAFLLRGEDIDRLKPEDRLLDIYRAAYPSQDTPDTLEFETLYRDLNHLFAVPEAELRTLTDMTIHEVIVKCLAWQGRRLTPA